MIDLWILKNPCIPGIKDLNVRSETIKLLEENIGKTLSDINHSRILYDPPPRILETKAKINKWDLIKIKSFCTTKENISKVKRYSVFMGSKTILSRYQHYPKNMQIQQHPYQNFNGFCRNRKIHPKIHMES